ncbi:hypothetical protein LUTEI9C_100132 [Luteimonas sp. 9C]|nr:hypothetical protein LUTEI9C_100132 [Luteimonas sp. 9C]
MRSASSPAVKKKLRASWMVLATWIGISFRVPAARTGRQFDFSTGVSTPASPEFSA